DWSSDVWLFRSDHGYPAAQLFSGERRLRQVGERHLLVVLLRRGNRRPQVGLHAEAIPRRGLPGIPLDLAEQVAAPFLAGLVVDAVGHIQQVVTAPQNKLFGDGDIALDRKS